MLRKRHFYHEGPSLQAWAIGVVKKVADGSGLLDMAKVRHALVSTPGYDWPEGTTAEGIIEMLSRQHFLLVDSKYDIGILLPEMEERS